MTFPIRILKLVLVATQIVAWAGHSTLLAESDDAGSLRGKPLSWALQPIHRPIPGPGDDRAWERGAIDAFVRARQIRASLPHSQEASRRRLARRVCFDLTGLPPRPELVEAFVLDSHPGAYERLVDQLLASPQFGERMAQHWLDLARYADSDGYHDDTNRAMWPYRDWVIRSYNKNKPFDQFTIEQLAGDLLPGATLEQKVATAFHRNAPTSSENGANPEEYRARYAVDRVNTTATVWLGLTAQCAECHDHKYDPLTTREYYQLFAFFNQTSEEPLFRGLYAPPAIDVPSDRLIAERKRIRNEILHKQQRLRAAEQQIEEDQRDWEGQFVSIRGQQFGREALVGEFLFEGEGAARWANTGLRRKPAVVHPSSAGDQPRAAQGLIGNSVDFGGAGGVVDLGQLLVFRRSGGFTIGAWIKFRNEGGCVISKLEPELEMRGFDLCVEHGRVSFRLIHQWPQAAIKVTTTSTYPSNRWLHLMVSYDGSADPQGIFIFFNGQSQELAIDQHTDVTGTIHNEAPILIGGRRDGAYFHGLIDDVQFYKWPLSIQDLVGGLYAKLDQIVVVPPAERAAEQADFIGSFYREHVHRPTIMLRHELAQAEQAEKKLIDSVPKLRVMQEIQRRRDTHVLIRGDFRRRGEAVDPRTPSFLPPMSESPQRGRYYTRLDLANWLVDPNHPLTARVTVNRFWAMLFGRGIVTTLDDFGTRGAIPSHPELLDWLAAEFMHDAWDVKKLLRRIVTSATYRQSTSATTRSWRNDPDNRFLTRGPRHRLPAEMIRDNALAISGLLVGEIGGPSVRPYQPPGLWRDLANADEDGKEYEQSQGADLYRRGIYTFWKRSIHYPSFSLFDAPSREVCVTQRPTTNTPLQALATLNDMTYVEAARVFAERILRESTERFEDRLDVAFRHALARPTLPNETEAIREIHDDLLDEYQRNHRDARRLIQAGEYPNAGRFDPAERATWTAIAQILLNLDETITKE